MSTLADRYLRTLQRWPAASEPFFYTCPDRPHLTCYGTGYNSWGVQTNQKALAALCVLATDPAFDPARAGMSRDDVLALALRLVRFSLESHVEGAWHCTDGTSWGHTWISALGVERMMHGVEAVDEHLTDADRALLRKVLISESDWLLDEYEIVADPSAATGRNRPESNLWNGAVLHRTAALYPDAPRAGEYREKGSRFLVNAVSLAADAASAALVDGRPVSEWFIGAQFFDSCALNHHGYLNVGYMVICLSNVAMLHFTCRRLGLAPPESLYHHVQDLWRLVRELVFPDGRLLRIGGDSRVRYCYCQDYLIPTLLLAGDLFGDPDAPALEAAWLAQVEHELDCNGDGLFLSERCRQLAGVSPLYFTRLESDRACTLSMGALWRRCFELSEPTAARAPVSAFPWSDAFHGASLVKSPRRVASWVWQAAEPPQGLCCPPQASDMAEWRENLAGEIRGQGRVDSRGILAHGAVRFDGGFLTWGATVARSQVMVAEGQPDDNELAFMNIAFAALPDDATVVALQRAVTPPRRVFVTSVKGIHLLMPNDLFNGNRRTYGTVSGRHELLGVGSDEQALSLEAGWVNVDDRLDVVLVYGDDPLTLYRPGRRQIGLKSIARLDWAAAGGMLYCDEICAPCRLGLRSVDPATVLFDVGFLLHTGLTWDETSACVTQRATRRLDSDSPAVRAVRVRGLDGRDYLLAANFGESPVAARIDTAGAASARDLAAGSSVSVRNSTLTVDLPAGAARLFSLDS